MTQETFASYRRTLAGRSIVQAALEYRKAAEATAKDGIFVSLVDTDTVANAATRVQARLARGEVPPLAGLPFAVKDNVDVAGMVSSSNCPGFGRKAETSAPAVEKAIEAGAILIGKNTMDQFATGLNGTRAPAPLCRNVFDPAIIPGGSSSGSAVAVARGLCAFALGSDTGGSGRVPAAANGIVGLKPTPGRVSGRGMVYCNRSFDVIPIFARSVSEAYEVFDVIGGSDALDPFAYKGAVDNGTLTEDASLATPRHNDLAFFGDRDAERAHYENLVLLSDAGFTIEEIDYAPFHEAGRLVFESAFIAERLADYGDFISSHPDAVLAPVREAIEAGYSYSARDAFAALYRLAELKLTVARLLKPYSGFVVPTIPRLYRIDEMIADPMTKNTVMGTYTYFANPLGLAAIAVPGRARADGLPSSLCIVGESGTEEINRQIALRFERAVTAN